MHGVTIQMKMYVLCVVMEEHAVFVERKYPAAVWLALLVITALKVSSSVDTSMTSCVSLTFISRMSSKYVWYKLHPTMPLC